jgi:predicted ester cyclase
MSATPKGSETPAARVGALDERLRAGDFEALRQFLAPDFFGAEVGEGEPSAADRITDLALAFKAALPDLTASLADVATDPDGNLTATLTVRGTHEGDLWGAPGSGTTVEWVSPVTLKPVDNRFAVRFDDSSTPQRVGLVRQLRLVNPADEMDQPSRYPVRTPEFLLKVVLTGEARDRPCTHLETIRVTEPTTTVCEQCEELGDTWPALRMCLVCGFVGCCDTSKHRHMAKHHEETGHSIFRSINLDEGWVWCYDDDAFFETSLLDRYR